ncbi:MAG: ABC transporter permease [Acidimicrobiaceae bacterium]|nr:ABC transporter permease [Acidimicrobiaceae bacterium]
MTVFPSSIDVFQATDAASESSDFEPIKAGSRRRRTRRIGHFVFRPLMLILILGLLILYLHTTPLDSIDHRSLYWSTIRSELFQQLDLTLISSAVVTALAVLLGILLTRRKAPVANSIVTALATLGQAAPPVGLMILAALVLGVGARTAIYALIIYSILPVLRNTVTGLNGLDKAILEAARGIGMRPIQILVGVELPLAVPVIMAGVRTAIILNVGTAALATFINGGGLGTMITTGIAVDRTPIIVAGSVLVAVFALAMDWAVMIVGELLSPS